MADLDSFGDVPPPSREQVVSPSQSAFGLRAYEDEGQDGEGEAPPEVEEDDFEAADLEEDDWDTVSGCCVQAYESGGAFEGFVVFHARVCALFTSCMRVVRVYGSM